MRALTGVIIIGFLMMNAPAMAESPGKWVKRAPFPEPSEELVGMSAGGKFFVFGGLGPGWIPQGLVYQYDPAADKWMKKKPMALPAHEVPAPRDVSGTPARRAASTIASSSSGERG